MIYKKHPFVNADKNVILHAKYETPKTCYSEKLMDLLTLLLIPDPELRPDSEKVLDIIAKWDKISKIEIPLVILKAKERFSSSANKENKNEEVQNEIEKSGRNLGERNLLENSINSIKSCNKIEELKIQSSHKKPSRELGICNYVPHASKDPIPGFNIFKDLISSENDNRETNNTVFLDKFRDNLKRTLNMIPVCAHHLRSEDQLSESAISSDMNKIESFKVLRMFERYIEKELINLENKKDDLRRLKREIKIIKLNYNNDSVTSESDYGGRFAIKKATRIDKPRKRKKQVSSDYDEFEEDEEDDFYSDEYYSSSSD